MILLNGIDEVSDVAFPGFDVIIFQVFRHGPPLVYPWSVNACSGEGLGMSLIGVIDDYVVSFGI